MRSTEPWIEDLLDLGVGALAIKTLYRMRRGDDYTMVCPRCGNTPRKWAVTCPSCRVPLVRRRRVEGA